MLLQWVLEMFKRKPVPYTQAEIKLQQGIVAEAIRQRDGLRDITDKKRADTAIECAQEILNFMMEEISSWQKKH